MNKNILAAEYISLATTSAQLTSLATTLTSVFEALRSKQMFNAITKLHIKINVDKTSAHHTENRQNS